MSTSASVQNVADKLQTLDPEEKRQLFTLVPSLWASIPVENLLTELALEEEIIRRSPEYRLNQEKQTRLSQLLENNRSRTLTLDEEAEIDRLIEESEELMLSKAQVLYTLSLLTKRLSQRADGEP